MTSFRFPPPPPPPPSTGNAQDSSQNGYSSNQRGGYNNPRGGRGWRGRGGGRGRGGNDRGNTRGGYGQQSGRSDGNWQPQAPHVSQNYTTGLPTSIPPGSYVNPQSQWAQAAQQNASFGPRGHFNSAPNPADQHHTGKRKRDSSYTGSANVQLSSRSPQQSKKPQRVKAEVAPAVPGFGFQLPVPRVPTASQSKQSGHKGTAGPKLHLGLTPRNGDEIQKEPDDDSGEEEDIDEEAVLGKDFKGISFEHNGQVISLQTPAEIAAFKKERKRQYPTKQRIVEKTRENATKRERELEFLRKVRAETAKAKGYALPESRIGNRREIKPKPQPQPPQDAASQKQKQLEELRKRVEASAAKKKALASIPKSVAAPAPEQKPPKINLGVNYESDTSESEVSSVVSSSEPDSDSEDLDDSDEAPEEQTSKVEPPTPKPPPPPPAKPVVPPKTKVCDHWKRDGHCKFGKRCRYAHPPREPKKRPGLFEVFVQKEKEQADALALQAIKYLGRHGLLG